MEVDTWLAKWYSNSNQFVRIKDWIDYFNWQMTWADIAYYAYFTTPIMTKLGGEVLVDAPHIKKLIDLVASNPNIKKYIETRPVTCG